MISEIEVRVIFADTDAMGVVYNGRYIEFMERGRMAFMRQMNYPYKKLEAAGVWLPVAKMKCKFKAPAKSEDVLVIRTRLSAIKGASIEMSYEILNKETGTLCFEGTTLHPATDPGMRPVRFKKMMPELYEAIKELKEDSFPPYKAKEEESVN